jgi:hypothetical protein
MTQLGRWSGSVKAGGREVVLEASTTLGTRDRSWGIRSVGIRDPQQPASIPEFQVWWFWLPAHFPDRIVHFYVNEDGDGKVWNRGLVMIHDDGKVEHLHDASLKVEFYPETRFPRRASIEARDEAGGVYRIEVEAEARFYLSGIGYMNPDWSHGLNKGAFAVGYDEIRTSEIVRYEAPYQHPQAFAQAVMTLPDGTTSSGFGCFESIVMGRHEPSGLSSMFDVP